MKEVRQKWDAVDRKTVGGLPDSLWIKLVDEHLDHIAKKATVSFEPA
jgi:hypothetical protein